MDEGVLVSAAPSETVQAQPASFKIDQYEGLKNSLVPKKGAHEP